uniref:Uncharacterized protein n=1 Tax=Desertifilum tharense IPPAS B-1220 TaxID=1781255 RepID=A0A1E5QEK0_9CYAN|nr:hypothetical protein BH720_21225 [Desertifilum tharense IPPAS B-1220]
MRFSNCFAEVRIPGGTVAPANRQPTVAIGLLASLKEQFPERFKSEFRTEFDSETSDRSANAIACGNRSAGMASSRFCQRKLPLAIARIWSASFQFVAINLNYKAWVPHPVAILAES